MRVVRRGENRWGGAVVEMAAVMPIFVALILGQIESSRLGMVAQLLTTAAREGCRVAVIDGKTNSDVTSRVNSFLTTIKVAGVSITQSPADCTTVKSTSTPNTITLTLSVPYANVSWLGSPRYFRTATLTASATMSSERP